MTTGRFQGIVLGAGLTGSDNADGTITVAASGGGSYDPATATTAWMPLADSDGTLVLDDTGNLIPTLIPL